MTKIILKATRVNDSFRLDLPDLKTADRKPITVAWVDKFDIKLPAAVSPEVFEAIHDFAQNLDFMLLNIEEKDPE